MSVQSAWSAVAFHTFKNILINGGGADVILITLATLDIRMIHCTIRGEAAPSYCLLILFVLIRGNEAEIFCVLKPCCNVTQYSSESGVILWGGNERGG